MAVDSFPGLPAGRGFVVVPREWIAAQAPAARMVPGVALVRAPVEAADAIRAELAATEPTLTVRSRAEDAEARRAEPVTGAVRSLILFAVLVTAAYAALGVAAALALAGLARALEVAHLRTLGLTARQSLALQAESIGRRRSPRSSPADSSGRGCSPSCDPSWAWGHSSAPRSTCRLSSIPPSCS